MTKPIGRDEQMYTTAGVLMAQGHLPYRDFSYAAQLPYHPLLYAAVFRLTGTTTYLLAGRLVSVVCDVGVIVLIVAIYRRIVGTGLMGTGLGLAGAVLYLFNPLVDYANGYAWNHDVVVFLVLASLGLYLSLASDHRSYTWKAVSIGALLGLASGMRITTALTIPVFGVALWLECRSSAIRARRGMIPFGAGLMAAAIWPVWVIAQAPQAFWLDLVKIPRLYGKWLQEIGMIHDKVALTWQCLTTPGYLVIVLSLLGLMIRIWRSGTGQPTLRRGPLAVTIGLGALFSWIAFIPPTMWLQYWAIPVPFWVVALAFPLSTLVQTGDRRRFRWVCGLTPLILLTVIAANPIVIWRIPFIADIQAWEPLKMHRMSEEIVAKIQAPKRVLTLAPLLALEGGCRIYPELSCGSIIYRIGDQLTPPQQHLTRTVGPKSLKDLIDAQPANAVIVGAEESRWVFLESTLQAVMGPGWGRQDYPNGLTVYLAP
jgi:hypothetical protein